MKGQHPLAQDARWLAVERILASRHFQKSKRLSAFLLYVTEKTLAGRVDEISEQQIGTQVFQKPHGYDAANDTIVRSTARQLRQRLAVYYLEDGANDNIQIKIPIGSYIPSFESKFGVDEPQIFPTVENSFEEHHSPAKHSRNAWLVPLFVAVLGVVLILGWRYGQGPILSQEASTKTSVFDRFWGQFLAPGRRLLFVPTDSGAVMFQNSLRRNLALSEYADGSYMGEVRKSSTASEGLEFGLRRYTAIADLRLFANLMRIPNANPNQIDLRFARDLQTADFKRGSVLLVGGPQGNPWVQLFEPTLNFSIHTDDIAGLQRVVSKNPAADESRFSVRFREPSHDIYSVIAFTTNLDQTGHVLLVSGTTMAGIEAAGDFLTNAERLRPQLEKFVRPNGSFPRFEIVLRTKNVGSGSTSIEVAATRCHDCQSTNPQREIRPASPPGF